MRTVQAGALLGMINGLTGTLGHTHTTEWAVQFSPANITYEQQANELAMQLGLYNLGNVGIPSHDLSFSV